MQLESGSSPVLRVQTCVTVKSEPRGEHRYRYWFSSSDLGGDTIKDVENTRGLSPSKMNPMKTIGRRKA
jgi:hypothetical protein